MVIDHRVHAAAGVERRRDEDVGAGGLEIDMADERAVTLEVIGMLAADLAGLEVEMALALARLDDERVAHVAHEYPEDGPLGLARVDVHDVHSVRDASEDHRPPGALGHRVPVDDLLRRRPAALVLLPPHQRALVLAYWHDAVLHQIGHHS